MSRGLAAVTATVCVAAVGVWLALLLFHTTAGNCPLPAPTIRPPATQPGAPVADWQPPQHRWETNHR